MLTNSELQARLSRDLFQKQLTRLGSQHPGSPRELQPSWRRPVGLAQRACLVEQDKTPMQLLNIYQGFTSQLDLQVHLALKA